MIGTKHFTHASYIEITPFKTQMQLIPERQKETKVFPLFFGKVTITMYC